MATTQIARLVEGTADAAFATNESGAISAWNKAAEELFGLTAGEAIGQACHEVVKAVNEDGKVCSEQCARAVENNCPVRNFDVRIQTKRGKKWSNISILIWSEPGSSARHAVHIVHLAEWRKQLERLARDFVARETEIERETNDASLHATNIRDIRVSLTSRETEILRLLSNGVKTEGIAERLGISRSTVRNHVKHIIAKLDSHNRYEALHRAERAGLL